jgi:acyl transferase domain-containing protein
VSDVFLFPGQGSENELPPIARPLLARVSAAVGVDVAALIAKGRPELARVEIAQPALIAIELSLALESDVKPALVAGHSAGELAAFCIAGCMGPEEAVDLAISRARCQAEAAATVPGTMVALHAERPPDGVEVAAHNTPDEWVLTGDRPALAALATRFATVPLAVGGPWHSRAMESAAERWRPHLQRVRWRRPHTTLIVNATGAELDGDPADALLGQLTRPVRWAETMQTLARLGGTRWHVFGPGRVMRGLCRANLGRDAEVQVHA